MKLKSELGQVFTEKPEAEKMVSLIKNKGTVLEPSAGNGNIFNLLPKDRSTAIEIDPEIASSKMKIMDFFDERNKYDTIIGNPPYLSYNDIPAITLNKLPKVMNKKANLYMFFIWRCLDLLNNNGELIFIVPREFIKLTSAEKLNERLNTEGGFTYWEEFGDQKVFNNASPNVVIFRWQKGIKHTIPIYYLNGFFYFDKPNGDKLSNLFDVKVGAVSGANSIYYNKNGNIELAYSETKKTGKLIKAYYGDLPVLLSYKEKLLQRKAAKFTENNWFEWVRKPNKTVGKKILVNCKTRDLKPFYVSSAEYWDGSLLALIPKINIDLDRTVEKLNLTEWDKLGFKVGGRLIFTQKSLSNIYIKLDQKINS